MISEQMYKAEHEAKRFRYFLAIKEFLEVYASQNFGYTPEMNIDGIANFMNSDMFLPYSLDVNFDSVDDICKMFEEEILNGLPVWRLFILPEWTSNMLEKSLAEDVEKAKSGYKCYTCKHFSERETSFGVVQRCDRKTGGRREHFELERTCVSYKEEK